MATRFAPKTWALTKEETPSSFETWKENLLFNLTIDGSFNEFLAEGFTWKAPTVLNRGLRDDEGDGQNKRTAAQKVLCLNMMLGSIAGYAPIIRRTFFTNEACSLHDIWSRLRTYYHFRKTGALILDYEALVPDPGESHESYWERLSAFVDDNLLSPTDNIKHLGAKVTAQERLSPTLLNLTVVHWLKCIHPGLPSLVKQKYATELRNSTLASLRDEISESLDSLVAELTGDNANVSRSYQKPRFRSQRQNQRSSNMKNCILCQTAKRPANHFLSQCPYLPEHDKRFMARARLVEASDNEEDDDEPSTKAISIIEENISTNLRRVDIEASPMLYVEYANTSVPVVIDSGAESNLIQEEFAKSTGATILKTSTTANQADGQSRLEIVGEVHIEFHRYPHVFKFNGLVARKLKDKVIAGMPFLSTNDIYVRPSKKAIHISDKEVIYYETRKNKYATNRSTAVILRIPRQTTLLPGDSLNLSVPNEFSADNFIAVEPRMNSQSLKSDKINQMWLKPHIAAHVDGKISLPNLTDKPILLKKHEQLCNIVPVLPVEETSSICEISTESQHPKQPTLSETTDYQNIVVDPDVSNTVNEKLGQLHNQYSTVFDSRTLGCYNGFSGPLEVKINMGPTLPKQRKGKMPLYNRSLQVEQQEICDSLEGTVFAKPEDLGIVIEYLNPSFLVRKPSGKKRLVTAFGEVGQYSKPQPALMPDVDQILRTISEWKYIIKTDLTSAYWQMPLSRESMKYCGIVTPFKGVRVYQRGAMGMPGTETALEELMCRILGNLIMEGSVTKIADDLYVGGDSPKLVISTWAKVLAALNQNGLKLSATKTVCFPQNATILGWKWSNGKLQASPHRLSALEAADLPKTVGQLRSYIGSFKFLSRVISSYSDVLCPLDEIAAGALMKR